MSQASLDLEISRLERRLLVTSFAWRLDGERLDFYEQILPRLVI